MRNDGNPRRQDVIGEAGNVGAGHAARALEACLGKGSALSPPRVSRGAPPVGALEVSLPLGTGLEGEILVLLEAKAAKRLLESLGGCNQTDLSDLDEWEGSVLCEMGNVLACAYLDAVAQMSRLTLWPEPPRLRVGGRIEGGGGDDLWVASRLTLQDDGEIQFVLRMSAGSAETLFETLALVA